MYMQCGKVLRGPPKSSFNMSKLQGQGNYQQEKSVSAYQSLWQEMLVPKSRKGNLSKLGGNEEAADFAPQTGPIKRKLVQAIICCGIIV